MGDEAMIMCNKGFQMVANHSSTTNSTSGQQGLEAIQDVRVICSQDGVWQRPFQYHCMDEEVHQELLAKVCSICFRFLYFIVSKIILLLLSLLHSTFQYIIVWFNSSIISAKVVYLHLLFSMSKVSKRKLRKKKNPYDDGIEVV